MATVDKKITTEKKSTKKTTVKDTAAKKTAGVGTATKKTTKAVKKTEKLPEIQENLENSLAGQDEAIEKIMCKLKEQFQLKTKL